MYSHKGASTLATAQQGSACTCANDALNPSMTKDTRKVTLSAYCFATIAHPTPHCTHASNTQGWMLRWLVTAQSRKEQEGSGKPHRCLKENTSKGGIGIIWHHFETIIFFKTNKGIKKSTYKSQKSLISPHCDESKAPAWTSQDEEDKRTKVQMILTSAQMSTVGERTKYLAPFFLSFDVVCQFTASTAVFSGLNLDPPWWHGRRPSIMLALFLH